MKPLALALLIWPALIAAPHAQPTRNGTLTIAGDLTTPMTLTSADLKQLPRTKVTTRDGARETTYEGVLVGDILKRAGAPIGQELQGRAIASYVLATAADGYQAVLAIAEVDPGVTDSEILVVDTVNGQPLPEAQGPLRLVAPHDKHPSRSVRRLERLDFVRLRK